MDFKEARVDLTNFSTDVIVKTFDETANNYREVLIESCKTADRNLSGMIFFEKEIGKIAISQFGTTFNLLNCLMKIIESLCSGNNMTALLLCQAGKLITAAENAEQFNEDSRVVMTMLNKQLNKLAEKMNSEGKRMNARQIKRAREEHLPVIVCNPNEPPIKCSYIKEVIYWFGSSGKSEFLAYVRMRIALAQRLGREPEI